MRIKNGFELREICGENVILSHGMDNIDFSKIISLNDTAAFLWKKASGKDFDEDKLVAALLETYDVEENTARQDVRQVIAKWKEIGLLEAYKSFFYFSDSSSPFNTGRCQWYFTANRRVEITIMAERMALTSAGSPPVYPMM